VTKGKSLIKKKAAGTTGSQERRGTVSKDRLHSPDRPSGSQIRDIRRDIYNIIKGTEDKKQPSGTTTRASVRCEARGGGTSGKTGGGGKKRTKKPLKEKRKGPGPTREGQACGAELKQR